MLSPYLHFLSNSVNSISAKQGLKNFHVRWNLTPVASEHDAFFARWLQVWCCSGCWVSMRTRLVLESERTLVNLWKLHFDEIDVRHSLHWVMPYFENVKKLSGGKYKRRFSCECLKITWEVRKKHQEMSFFCERWEVKLAVYWTICQFEASKVWADSRFDYLPTFQWMEVTAPFCCLYQQRDCLPSLNWALPFFFQANLSVKHQTERSSVSSLYMVKDSSEKSI